MTLVPSIESGRFNTTRCSGQWGHGERSRNKREKRTVVFLSLNKHLPPDTRCPKKSRVLSTRVILHSSRCRLLPPLSLLLLLCDNFIPVMG